MFGRTGVTWVLAASAFWLSACAGVNEPEKDLPPETKGPSRAAVQQIT